MTPPSSPLGPSPRRFGLTLGLVLLALAVIITWRGHVPVAPSVPLTPAAPLAMVAAGAGGLLVLLGLVLPQVLSPVLRAWMALGHVMGLVMTPVLFTLLWLVAFVPVGVLRRTLARSPLARDPQARSYWVSRPSVSDEAARASMQRQF